MPRTISQPGRRSPLEKVLLGLVRLEQFKALAPELASAIDRRSLPATIAVNVARIRLSLSLTMVDVVDLVRSASHGNRVITRERVIHIEAGRHEFVRVEDLVSLSYALKVWPDDFCQAHPLKDLGRNLVKHPYNGKSPVPKESKGPVAGSRGASRRAANKRQNAPIPTFGAGG